MNANPLLGQIERVGAGLSFILFPILFIFAFAVHPGLLKPRLLRPSEIILRARGNRLLQFGHVLVTLSTPLLLVATLHFQKLLSQTPWGWAGFAGGAAAVLGIILLAADKGALCLTMSAFDTLPEDVFAKMMPGVMAMFAKKGWMALLWGILMLPLGFAIQSAGLMASSSIPLWQGMLFLVGVLLVAVPDGLEIINLGASVMMAAALIPYGAQIITKAL